MTRVFISHSSTPQDDRLTTKVLEQVAQGLRAKNHVVTVDSDTLKPGQNWCPTLYQWLAECDAAVVLFNHRALKSFWVRREVNILLWRRALNPGLLVIPVLIGGLRTADLKEHGFSDVLPVQSARAPSEVPDESAVALLATQILDQVAELPDLTNISDSMRRWIGQIANHLGYTRKKESLTEVGHALGLAEEYLPKPDAYAQRDASLFIAHQMLDTSLGPRLTAAIWAVAPHLEDESLRGLITQVVPAWVNGEAARGLLPGDHEGGHAERRIVVLNADQTQTAQQFIDRAMCLDMPHYWVEAAGGIPMGEDPVAELFDHCVVTVRRLLAAPPDLPVNRLRTRPDCLHFLALTMRGLRPQVTAEVVRRLHTHFPWLIVVLLTGEDAAPTQDTLSAWHLDDAVVLSPSLSGDEEIDGYRFVHDLRAIPERQKGSWR